MSYKVLVTDPLAQEGLSPLINHELMEVDIQTQLTEEELLQQIKDVDALLVRSQTAVTRHVIENAPNLKIIGRAGVGVDNIDLEAATERGILVVNAPAGNTNSAAEHTMAMLMSLARNIPQAYTSLQNKEWNRGKYIGVEVKNKTLGIIGFGKIGEEVAHRAKGQRMNIIAYDPFLTEEKGKTLGIKVGTVDDVLKESDFITVHTPLIEATKHLLNAEAFQKVKPGVRILNCARGGIIDEKALYQAIETGIVKGAALDVFEDEPAIDNPLLKLPEVIATPHLGGSTVEAQLNVAADISHDVTRFFAGEAVEHPVNIPAISKETMHKVEPYLELAEKLGIFLSRTTEQGIQELMIHYEGELSERELAPLTRSATKGFMKRFFGHTVNDVNAIYLAKQKEIIIREQRSTTKDETNALTVAVQTKDKQYLVKGIAIEGVGIRIIHIDQYRVDVVPDGNLLLIKHHDKPGAIGKVGSILGEYDVNIATMQVDRADLGGNAMMILTVDKHPEQDALDALRHLNGVDEVTAIDL